MIKKDDLLEDHSVIMARYLWFCFDYLALHTFFFIVMLYFLCLWQQNFNTRLKVSLNDCEILFVVDLNGNAGKSWFAKYFFILYDLV